MSAIRRDLLGLLAATTVLSAAVLWDVLGTVFFGITLAVVAGPLYGALVDRGLARWWASVATTAVVFATGLALFAPFVNLLYQRRVDIVERLRSLPAELTLGVGDFEVVLVTGDALDAVVDLLRSVAFAMAEAAPVLGVKLTLLGVVLFALLLRRDAAMAAVMGAVPAEQRGIAERLAGRIRETLLAIYVLQAATALGTFAIAFPLFLALGYDLAFTLAVVAGLLQFLPVVGPSVVVGVLVVAELMAGDVVGAAVVGVAGWLLVAMLPDLLIRPRLAERTANLPGSLYFVGFTGGLLTVGPVGVIAGPLAVALLQEAVVLVGEEIGALPDEGSAGVP